MPGKKPLATPSDLIFLYDGSLQGFYCCVHEAVYSRQLPMAILPEEEAQPTLLLQRRVETDPEKADKVRASIPRKICPRALELVQNVYMSCLPDRELHMLRFLLTAYREGRSFVYQLGHPEVSVLFKAERQLLHEAHLFTGFVRFADYDGALVSTIEPKNFVLPYVAGHFSGRYGSENFLIYDKTHGAALIHQDGRTKVVPLTDLALPETGEEERRYQELWKRFYDTIAIEERTNPKCRMSHMPKRYWANMTEMKRLL